MIYDEQLFELEDAVLNVVDSLEKSQLTQDYLKHYTSLEENHDVDKLVIALERANDKFEQVSKYGKFAPDFKEKRRELRKIKRQVDTHPLISEFKISETELQNVLDYIALDLSQSISKEIKVDAGNPFFEFASRGCGGSCHVK
ncbi:YlbF family regulator [Vagococcus silagei]|uniref:YlbF family regulator n=1 Tax=Vagococcus silagei TaxID=2508885 RepID=A0A4S3B6E0_9ENTE|nr:YlbF family regulator [Vagococcus silagei]THB61937.1 YlbF family regulator [Vagococcus silagei]